MRVDGDPFPSMSVGVNAVDLKSIARDRTQPYSRCRLVADDMRWIIKEIKACRKQIKSGSSRRRKHRGHNITQQKNNTDQGTVISGHAEKPRMVKPPPRSLSKRWECVVHPKFPKVSRETSTTDCRLGGHGKSDSVAPNKKKIIVEKRICVDISEVVYEGEEEDSKDQITLEELDLTPKKLNDLKAEVQDPLGLERNLVEHRLPIKEGFKPFKQPPRRMSPEVTLKVKEEIEQLLKNGKLRIRVDFRNLNLATPKDEYPTPIADLLVDGAARHRVLSFMDGHCGYNQIFIVKEDIPKTAFCCPGAIGTYEWVVMPFGLKNASATYQRAMNAIFHDMIGCFMEIYSDDVVVKSNEDEEHLMHLKLAFERMRKHGLKMNPLKCAFGVFVGNFLGYLEHERGLEVDQNKARIVIEA
ncbi:hypothetical protein SLEP1_g24702 [Rubroshorea leprosula]|uniref:Reverse transcriptase domain-containing protein n=1 Tax=Rubroshorea leprosula TaxID=152421 RepID=A0AAV5JLS9_9ROSI|nr:hypothetical protein SLEP1_g24702 [Rubroshorea leprosula]